MEAENIEELKTIIKIMPPPIPTNLNKKKIENPTVNVNLGFGAKNERESKKNLITEITKIKTAKELKTIFKIFLLSLILSLFSYPIIAWKDIKAISLKSDYEKVKFDKNSSQYSDVTYEILSLPTGLKQIEIAENCSSLKDGPYASFGYGPRFWDYDCILSNYVVFKNDNIKLFFSFLAASFLIILIIRYSYIATKKTTKWVNENSQKEI